MRHERHPDDRYCAALRAQLEPSNSFESALWQLHHQGVVDETIVRVVDAYEDIFERELLQAWMIAGASDDDIHLRLGISLAMLAPFRHLCCNLNAFRDKLEMLRWINMYSGSKVGKLMFERAAHFDGVEAIAHYCGLRSTLEPSHVNEQAMRETYFRSIGTMRATTITSTEAAAAHQLMKTALTAAGAAQKRGAPNFAETLIKLKHREMTFHVDDVMAHGEILH